MVQVTKPPQGASLFGDPADAPLDGHFHRLPAGTVLPQELGIVADGSDTEGGIYELTHHTIYPKDAISPLDFVRLFEALPWEYAGRK